MKKNSSITSYIEDHEEEEAKQFIEGELGFRLPKAIGKRLIVKIYVRPEEISTFQDNNGKTVHLYMPPIYLENDKYSRFAALVLSVGDQCFKGEEYKEAGPGCKVGDWVTIARNYKGKKGYDGCQQYFYRGVAVQDIPEEAIYEVIEDPSYVERLT